MSKKDLTNELKEGMQLGRELFRAMNKPGTPTRNLADWKRRCPQEYPLGPSAHEPPSEDETVEQEAVIQDPIFKSRRKRHSSLGNNQFDDFGQYSHLPHKNNDDL